MTSYPNCLRQLRPAFLVWTTVFCGVSTTVASGQATKCEFLVEAEEFQRHGGWVVDPQFVDAMGSPYLLAHGLGNPVPNANTVIHVPQAGRYQIWVRTKNWVPSHHPGTFQIRIGDRNLAATYGNLGDDWIWQKGDVVELSRGDVDLELQDQTGFDGRCDAIFFTNDLSSPPPPSEPDELLRWRRTLHGLPDTPRAAGRYDVVVVGGGIAGCSATLAAARLGLRVALVQNRPVLGGNASPEIGITPRGQPGPIVDELVGPERERVIKQEPGIDLFLNWHAFNAVVEGKRIRSIDARHTMTNQELRFTAPVFIDCSGVGAVGFLVGADYRFGREAQTEFNESLAPKDADKLHHGNTIVFCTELTNEPVPFPEVPWARKVAGDFAELGGQVVDGRDNIRGLTHFWEYGQHLDPFRDGEHIRDHLLCALYGTFANVKLRYPKAAAGLRLKWVGIVPAGGESRRLMGDYILTENDIRTSRQFPDAVAQCSGHFCLHYPGSEHDFRLGDWKFVPVKPYSIPYRCLYSRNVENLLMAGKHISVSHIAGSSTKTMLNGGQMGVAVGAAAYLCKRHRASPREVGTLHLTALQDVIGARGEFVGWYQKTEAP